jgi:5,10-methylene-tetrahydrofolate dehydrogenase/methenyl tetrahydrofolate cyclohydrolase
MQILDGKKAAQAIKDKLKIDVAQLATEGKKIPHLVAILVGNNGASETYRSEERGTGSARPEKMAGYSRSA